MSNTATNRKASKKDLVQACNAFFWTLDWVTGGTTEETIRQAPSVIADLEERAAIVATLAANPNKIAAADSHLMNRAASIPERLESYRARYLCDAAKVAGEFFADYRAAGDPVHPSAQSRVLGDFREMIEQPTNIIQFPGR
jgi:hypothetical protein